MVPGVTATSVWQTRSSWPQFAHPTKQHQQGCPYPGPGAGIGQRPEGWPPACKGAAGNCEAQRVSAMAAKMEIQAEGYEVK